MRVIKWDIDRTRMAMFSITVKLGKGSLRGCYPFHCTSNMSEISLLKKEVNKTKCEEGMLENT